MEGKYKAKYGRGHKVLTSTQMLQKLPREIGLVKAGNTSENLLNGFRQVIYSMYQVKGITKNVYYEFNKVVRQNRKYIYEFWEQKNIGSLQTVNNYSIFRIKNLKVNNKYVALSNLGIYYTWKNKKSMETK